MQSLTSAGESPMLVACKFAKVFCKQLFQMIFNMAPSGVNDQVSEATSILTFRKDATGMSCLSAAAGNGNLELLSFLLENGTLQFQFSLIP
jgi:hypothetical protein